MQSTPTRPIIQRTLILIRHAKAVDEDAGGDHARRLSERGQKDAAALGDWLREQGLKPELALCSTATRTRETLAGLSMTIPTILSDKLYLASTGEMLSQIQSMDDAVGTLMLVCHNPGAHAILGLLVEDFVNPVDADRMLLKFPTAACAVMTFNASRWQDVAPLTATLEQLRY